MGRARWRLACTPGGLSGFRPGGAWCAVAPRLHSGPVRRLTAVTTGGPASQTGPPSGASATRCPSGLSKAGASPGRWPIRPGLVLEIPVHNQPPGPSPATPSHHPTPTPSNQPRGRAAEGLVLDCLPITNHPLALAAECRPLHQATAWRSNHAAPAPPGPPTLRKPPTPPGVQARRKRAPVPGPQVAKPARRAGERQPRTRPRAASRLTSPACWRGAKAHHAPPGWKPLSQPGVLARRECASLPTGGCSSPRGPVPGWATVLSGRSLASTPGWSEVCQGWAGGPSAKPTRNAPLTHLAEARHSPRSERPDGHVTTPPTPTPPEPPTHLAPSAPTPSALYLRPHAEDGE